MIESMKQFLGLTFTLLSFEDMLKLNASNLFISDLEDKEEDRIDYGKYPTYLYRISDSHILYYDMSVAKTCISERKLDEKGVLCRTWDLAVDLIDPWDSEPTDDGEPTNVHQFRRRRAA